MFFPSTFIYSFLAILLYNIIIIITKKIRKNYMIKKLCIITLISALMFNLTALAKENEKVTRQEIADKNLEILFNITTKNNNGPDKDFMDILQKYIFGEVFTIGDLDMKTRELLTVTSLTVMQTLP